MWLLVSSSVVAGSLVVPLNLYFEGFVLPLWPGPSRFSSGMLSIILLVEIGGYFLCTRHMYEGHFFRAIFVVLFFLLGLKSILD